MKVLVRTGNMICELPIERNSDIVIQPDAGKPIRIYVKANGAFYVGTEIPTWAQEKFE